MLQEKRHRARGVLSAHAGGFPKPVGHVVRADLGVPVMTQPSPLASPVGRAARGVPESSQNESTAISESKRGIQSFYLGLVEVRTWPQFFYHRPLIVSANKPRAFLMYGGLFFQAVHYLFPVKHGSGLFWEGQNSAF